MMKESPTLLQQPILTVDDCRSDRYNGEDISYPAATLRLARIRRHRRHVTMMKESPTPLQHDHVLRLHTSSLVTMVKTSPTLLQHRTHWRHSTVIRLQW